MGQMKEIKLGQVKLQESTVSSPGVVDEQLTDISRTAAKGEQYHRRDTLTVTGVLMASEETDVQLENKVATSLSLSGEAVTPTNFSVIHRNEKQIKTTHTLNALEFGGKLKTDIGSTNLIVLIDLIMIKNWIPSSSIYRPF